MSRKSKFSDAQIIAAVKEVKGGSTMIEVARRVGVSTETLSRWRAKFGGVSESQEKRRLEDENRKLRSLVAQYALEVESMKVVLGKKW